MRNIPVSNKKRKHIVILVVSVLIIGGLFYLQFYMRRASAPQLLGEAVRFINTQEKVIALTYDDGPNPESTEAILTLLDEYDSEATFFVIGENAEQHPQIIEAITDSGCEIGNHSWSHQRLTYKSPEFIKNEIEKTDNIIRSLGYGGSIPFRAPYGHKLLILPYILMKSERTNYLWSIEFDDWESPPVNDMLEILKAQIKPGAVLLLHDGYTDGYQSRQAAVDFTEQLLMFCKENGYKVVTVSELESYKQ